MLGHSYYFWAVIAYVLISFVYAIYMYRECTQTEYEASPAERTVFFLGLWGFGLLLECLLFVTFLVEWLNNRGKRHGRKH